MEMLSKVQHDPRTILVINLSHETKDTDVFMYFYNFGALEEVKIKMDERGVSQRIAIVRFQTDAAATSAVKYRPHRIRGQMVNVIRARQKCAMELVSQHNGNQHLPQAHDASANMTDANQDAENMDPNQLISRKKKRGGRNFKKKSLHQTQPVSKEIAQDQYKEHRKVAMCNETKVAYLNPLAIRFTKVCIQSDHCEKDAIGQIVATKFTRPEDAEKANAMTFLDAQFAPIQVFRHGDRMRDLTGQYCTSGDGNYLVASERWLALDNYRLYCMQRVAAEMWPTPVVIPVQVLNLDSEDVCRRINFRILDRDCGAQGNGELTLYDPLKEITKRPIWKNGDQFGRWSWEEYVAQQSCSFFDDIDTKIAFHFVSRDE